MKKLRKTNNKLIFGVCGGIAEYFNIDATIVRLIAVLIAAFCGAGFFVYIVMAIIMPESYLSYEDLNNLKSANVNEKKDKKESKEEESKKDNIHSDDDFNSYFNNK